MTLAVDIVLRHYPDRDHATAKNISSTAKKQKIYIYRVLVKGLVN